LVLVLVLVPSWRELQPPPQAQFEPSQQQLQEQSSKTQSVQPRQEP
jgi:hypothetical protein